MSPLDPNEVPSDHVAIAAQVMGLWSHALVTVLESMTAQLPKIEVQPSKSRDGYEALAWWGQRFSILDLPSFWIGAPAESWTELGRLTLSALGVEDATEVDIDSTCRDLMAQTSAMVASQLTHQFGEEITGGDSMPGSDPTSQPSPLFQWSLDAGSMTMQGSAVWAGEFLEHCAEMLPDPHQAPAGHVEVEAEAGDGPRFGGRLVDSIPRLDLKVKFILGRARMPLRDIFKLNVGSVIELDRTAIEPADVVIHGRVLARGQVVVVNGNYGLKIMPHH